MLDNGYFKDQLNLDSSLIIVIGERGRLLGSVIRGCTLVMLRTGRK
jgi:hypothetical protein